MTHKGDTITILAHPDAKLMVNGKPSHDEIELHHNDRYRFCDIPVFCSLLRRSYLGSSRSLCVTSPTAVSVVGQAFSPVGSPGVLWTATFQNKNNMNNCIQSKFGSLKIPLHS